MSYVVGVDSCRRGWVAAVNGDDASLKFELYETFAQLIRAHDKALCIAVDIPIGLVKSFGQKRSCDAAARDFVGPRFNSVFFAPARQVFDYDSHEAASTASKSYVGKGFSIQAYSIIPKIIDVDRVMTPDKQGRIVEIHPEVCFRAASGRHLVNSKKSTGGFAERLSILRTVLPNTPVPTWEEARTTLSGSTPDDILDATIAAWSAGRHAAGVSKRLPEYVEIDSRGLIMEMIY